MRRDHPGAVYTRVMEQAVEGNHCFDLLKETEKPFVALDSYLSEYDLPALVYSNGLYGMYKATRCSPTAEIRRLENPVCAGKSGLFTTWSGHYKGANSP